MVNNRINRKVFSRQRVTRRRLLQTHPYMEHKVPTDAKHAAFCRSSADGLSLSSITKPNIDA